MNVLIDVSDNSVQCVVTSPPIDQVGEVPALVETFREIRRVLRGDGTVWMHLGGRGPVDLPWRVALAFQADGWYLRSDIIWSKSMDSNDHDRPSRSHDYLFMFAANDRYFYDADAIREKSDSPFSLSAVRLAGGVMGGERPQGDNFDKKARHTEGKQTPSSRAERAALLNPSGRNKRTVWTLPPGSDPTVMPPEMVSQCVLAGTSERGCCRVCLSPWVRVVERGPGRMDRPNHSYNPSRPDGMKLRGGRLWSGSVLSESWKPTCFCNPSDGPIPCDVLDPFNDRGVVGSVARDLGRSFLGLKSDTRKADPVQEKDDDVQSDSVMSLFT